MLRRPQQPNYEPLDWIEPSAGPATDGDSDQARLWRTIGRRLYNRRKALRISQREAARRAGISDTLWRVLEDGFKSVDGRRVLPNPRADTLLAVLKAVGEDPNPVFEALGHDLPPTSAEDLTNDRILQKLKALTERDRVLIERLLDSMLDLHVQPPPPLVSFQTLLAAALSDDTPDEDDPPPP